MAKQIVTLEVVRCEDIITCISQVGQLSKLSIEFFLKELNSWLIVQLVSLKEMKKIAFFLDELKLVIGLFQSIVFLL
jgi:hypothetical protein